MPIKILKILQLIGNNNNTHNAIYTNILNIRKNVRINLT